MLLLRGSVRRFIYNAFFPPLTKQFMCSCTAVPLVFHVVLSTLEACKAWPPYLSPVYISPSPVPSAIVTNDSTLPSFLWLFATILPQRWKQLIIARRLIVAICGMFQGFFSYGIIRRVNLFSDQSPLHNLALVLCILICLGFSEITTSNSDIWRSLWSRVLSRGLLISANSARVTFFYHSAISDLKWLEKTP